MPEPEAKGLDSVSRIDVVKAKALGYTFGLRYLDNGENQDTCLDEAEAQTYTDADFGIGSLCEISADAAAGGESAGIAFAQLFVRSALLVCQPKGSTLYAATDVDPRSLPAGAGLAFYRGFSEVRRSGYLAGAYAGALLDDQALAAGVIDRVMIPGASSWSDGATAKRVDIDQEVDQVTIGGATFDVDLAELSTAGLWTLKGLWPARAPATPTPKEVGEMAFLARIGGSWAVVDEALKSKRTLVGDTEGVPVSQMKNTDGTARYPDRTAEYPAELLERLPEA